MSQGHAAAAFTAPKYVKSIGQAGDAFIYPWGMATETFSGSPYYGDIIVGDYNNYDLKVFNAATALTNPGAFVATISQRGAGLGSMGQPYGIAVDPTDGSIYVADQNHFRVDKFNDAGVFEYAISPSYAYYAPYVAVNSSGDLFIVESTITDPSGTNEIFEYSNTGTYITTYVGTDGTNCAAAQFGNIRGVDVDSSDRLYVIDTTNHCIQVFNTANGAPASAWTMVDSFGSSTHLSGDTRNLTIDRSDNLVYVADAANNVVDVFTTWNGASGGVFQGVIGSSGLGDGQIGGERGVAVGLDHTVYASDYTYWRINAYSPLPSGTFLLQMPSPPMPPPAGGFNNPTAVAVSTFSGSLGDVYVADTFNQRIQEFANNGTWLTMWGSRLSQLGAPYAFDYPRGVAVDPATGDVWVNDTRSGYIKEYTPDGTYIAEYGGPGDFDYAVGIYVANGKVYADDSDHDQLQALNTTTGAEAPGFPVTCGKGIGYGDNGGCTGVTTDAAGNIYAAAEEEDLVEVYNPSGKLIGTIGSPANLSGPYDTAVVGTTLFVTDANSNRVTEFNISKPTSATLLGTWGTTGAGNGQFTSPRGISADASGNIYIVDYGNSRVEEFNP